MRAKSEEQTAPLRPTDIIGTFFLAGIAFMAVGGIVAVLNLAVGLPWGRWAALHLIFVGGISQLVIGASQFFAGAFLATDPPPRRLVQAQFALWCVGSALLAAALPLGERRLAYPAAALLLVALSLYARGLFTMRARSLRTAPMAYRWYTLGAAFFAVGICFGVALAAGEGWQLGNPLAAHMALNIGGWFGTAIVGTLHTFYPSLTKTQLSFPRLERATLAGWGVGIASVAAGYALALDPLVAAGFLALTLAATSLAFNLIASWRAAPRPLSLPARLLGPSQAFLVAGLAIATVTAATDGAWAVVVGSDRTLLGALLVAGWVGVTVVASLLHLLAVMIRVRNFRRPLPEPRPLRDSLLVAGVLAGIAFLALAYGSGIELDGLAPRLVAALAACSGAAAGVYLLGRVLALSLTLLTQAKPSLR